MCIFSGPVLNVSSTKIFARLEGTTQYLAYSMNFSAKNPVAMILPIPAAKPNVHFYNLEHYPNFFQDLEKAFQRYQPKTASFRSRSFAAMDYIPVENVGSFEASVVPSLRDFSRLDPRFRLPSGAEAALSKLYPDYVFMVFQLREGKIHPMAFSFTTKEQHSVFYPTVHVHHDKWEDTEEFDHDLYLQLPSARISIDENWTASLGPLSKFLNFSKLIDDVGMADVVPTPPIAREGLAYKMRLSGRNPNQDVRFDLANSCHP